MKPMNLTAVLVDDEQSTLQTLERQLNELFPHMEIRQSFHRPEDALRFLRESANQPDIVFLDVQMPRMDGLELLAQLGEIRFQLIFVTAHPQYALDAIKHSAVDYILKPIDPDDLQAAVQKAVERIRQNREQEQTRELIALLGENIRAAGKIIVPTPTGLSFIPVDEVLHIEGTEGYTKFHLTDGSELLSSYNIGKFEKKLDQRVFFKCHKSHIINIHKVRSYENEGYIVLENNYRVPISRANRKFFLDLFQ